MNGNYSAVDELRRLADKARVTLAFSARDERHNNAVVLKEYLQQSSLFRHYNHDP